MKAFLKEVDKTQSARVEVDDGRARILTSSDGRRTSYGTQINPELAKAMIEVLGEYINSVEEQL